MKYYLNAINIDFGDPICEVFDTLDGLEEFILRDHSALDNIRVIKGDLLEFELRVNWK